MGNLRVLQVEGNGARVRYHCYNMRVGDNFLVENMFKEVIAILCSPIY